MKVRKTWGAFTLIELIVVIVILGILAAIAAVSYNVFISGTEEASAETSVAQTDKLITGQSAYDQKTLTEYADGEFPQNVIDEFPQDVTDVSYWPAGDPGAVFLTGTQAPSGPGKVVACADGFCFEADAPTQPGEPINFLNPVASTGGSGGSGSTTALSNFAVTVNPDNTATATWDPSAGQTYEQNLNNTGWVPATSPSTTPVLGEGNYTFEVRSTDETQYSSDSFSFVSNTMEMVVNSNATWNRVDGQNVVFDTGTLSGTTAVLYFSNPNVTVNWGDGSSDTLSATGQVSHTYAPGSYSISVSGTADSFRWVANVNTCDRIALESVSSFGQLGLTSLDSAFNNANVCGGSSPWISNFAVSASLPSTVTTLNSAFEDAKGFNSPLGSWDTSNVSVLTEVLDGAWNFDQNLSSWDVSGVSDFRNAFAGARSFNNGGAAMNWDMSNATGTRYMFFDARVFNADISNWDVSGVNNMANMFQRARVFNQDISGWDVSNVADFSQMFRDADAFNQDISTWNTGSATQYGMASMFVSANVFSQDLSGWCVTNVTDSSSFFAGGSSMTSAQYPVWGTCPNPSVTPGAVTAFSTDRTATMLNLSWSAPADAGSDPITGYEIEDVASGYTTTVGSTAASLMYANLYTPADQIDLRVRAVSAAGNGSWTNIVGNPMNAGYTIVNGGTQTVVSWGQPFGTAATSIVTGYTVVDTGTGATCSTGSSTTTCLLNAGATGDVIVKATTAQGESLPALAGLN